MKILIGLLISTSAWAAAVNMPDQVYQHVHQNVLKNPGMESAGGWSSAASSPTYSPTSAFGNYSLSWNALASGNTLLSDLVTIPRGAYGKNGAFFCSFRTASGTSALTLTVTNGTDNLVDPISVISDPIYQKVGGTFVFPVSGSVQLKISATQNEPAVNIDDCYLGLADGTYLTDVSQASLYGTITYPGTASCVWSTTSTTYANFGADTDCGTAVATGAASLPGTKIPGITFASLPPGNYYFVAQGGIYTSISTTHSGFYRFSDGTNTSGDSLTYGAGSAVTFPNITGWIKYDTAQTNVTIQVQGHIESGATGAVNIYAVQPSFEIQVYRFPTASETAYRPDMTAMSWSGYHGTGCGWSAFGVPPADPSDDGSGCSLTETKNTNFGSVVTYGAAKPGITFMVPKAGAKYLVTVNMPRVVVYGDGAGDSGLLRLYGDTSILAQASPGGLPATNPGLYTGVSLTAIYDPVTIGSHTLSIRIGGNDDNTTTYVQGSATSNFDWGAVYWSVVEIDQSLPAPLLVGSVTSGNRSEMFLQGYNGYGSTDARIPRYTNTISDTGTAAGDWVVADSATLGTTVTIGKSGLYSVEVSHESAAAAEQGAGFSVNSTQKSTCIQDTAAATVGCYSHMQAHATFANIPSCSHTLWLSVGDVVRPHVCTGGVPSNAAHSIFKITKHGNYQ